MPIDKPMTRFSRPDDIQSPVPSRSLASKSDLDEFLSAGEMVEDKQTSEALSQVRQQEQTLSQEESQMEKAKLAQSLITGAGGAVGFETGRRLFPGSPAVGTLAGAASSLVAAGLTSDIVTNSVRELFGLKKASREEINDADSEAVQNELISLGIGGGVKAITNVGGRLLQSALNNTSQSRLKALVDLEQGLTALKKGATASMTSREAKEYLGGALDQRLKKNSAAISSFLTKASVLESKKGKSSALNLMNGLRETLQNEGAIFVDDVLMGFDPSRIGPTGKAIAPFGDSKSGRSILNDLVEKYEYLRRQKNGTDVPIRVIDDIRDSFRNISKSGRKEEYSGAGIAAYEKLQGLAAQDRDIAFQRLFSGTVDEKNVSDAYLKYKDEIDTLEGAKSILSSNDISDLIIRDTSSKQKANIISDVVSLFGKESEVTNSLRSAFVNDLLTPDPVVGFANPNKILRKIEEADQSLVSLFSKKEIIDFKKSAIFAKRLNTKNFANSEASQEFTNSLVNLASSASTNPQQTARNMFKILKDNKLVLDEWTDKMIERARSMPKRDGERIQNIADSIADYLAFSRIEEGKNGVIKAIPGPILTRMLANKIRSGSSSESVGNQEEQQ